MTYYGPNYVQFKNAAFDGTEREVMSVWSTKTGKNSYRISLKVFVYDSDKKTYLTLESKENSNTPEYSPSYEWPKKVDALLKQFEKGIGTSDNLKSIMPARMTDQINTLARDSFEKPYQWLMFKNTPPPPPEYPLPLPVPVNYYYWLAGAIVVAIGYKLYVDNF